MDEYALNICVTYQHLNIKDIARTLAGAKANLADAFTFRIIAVNLSINYLCTERIACSLCMHLGACRFVTHPAALMHLKSILSECIHLHFNFLAHYRMGSH